MLMIRLQRVGKKNEPHFRVVLTEKTTSPRGKHIELLGFLDPKSKARSIKKERVLHWMSKGAKLSDTVHNILVSEKVLEVKKTANHSVLKKNKKSK